MDTAICRKCGKIMNRTRDEQLTHISFCDDKLHTRINELIDSQFDYEDEEGNKF